ncbi:MAG TPA: YARHG domain-containing protein [Thermoanaerobaculia bacterium]|nr:YARHG domain-containing protein [Thermoanaerobaculia bacterium]
MRTLALLFLLAATSWETFDYSTKRLSDAGVAGRSLDELRLMRGIIFGRHGRVFGVDRDIDRYLRAQGWYKADPGFDNTMLTEIERANLDVIRKAEALRHAHVEPGDMRWWKTRALSEAQLGEHSGPELRVLLAEVEAIHGRVFDDAPTLQQYFDARYWYAADRDYDPKVLTATERKNMEVIESAIRRQRKVVLLPGDLGPYMAKPITPQMLAGVGLHELRFLRNEIYARRGREFKTFWLQNWFSQYSWYQPNERFRDEQLTAVQKNNVKVITARERELHDLLSSAPLATSMLDGLFTEDLRRLRNEIYARHGRPFKDAALRGYFESLDWYRADPAFDEASLSPVERANAELIQRMEKEASSQIVFEG